MSKENNQFNVDFAFPGLCTLCHTEVAEFEGSNYYGKPKITRLLTNHTSLALELDDGSEMVVTMCRDCFNNLSESDKNKIMQSEIDGWEHELNTSVNSWSDDKKQKYRDKYYKLKIKKFKKGRKGK